MKRILLLGVTLLWSIITTAQQINLEQAKRVAINFMSERVRNSSIYQDIPLFIEGTILSDGAYYICNFKPTGYAIVSSTMQTQPILAYSFESSFPEITDQQTAIKNWMNHYREQILDAIKPGRQNSTTYIANWQHFLKTPFEADDNKQTLAEVAPLLTSKWNQGKFYNEWCPADPLGPGGHCYAGCVATAMGQLLNYYRFPQYGTGSYTYTHPVYGTIGAYFGSTTYKWDQMPASISNSNNAIAELLFHLGVSVDMDYGPSGSGMWNHKAAYSLKTYFGFGPETQYYFRDSVSIDWDSLLVTNLNQRKPLYYAGWAGVQSTSGHAFVCDGYQPGNYYHFNWGWGGSYDGYFYTDNLTPGGSNFNFAQEVIPMFPDTIAFQYPYNQAQSDTLTEISGSVEDGSGWFDYLPNQQKSWLLDIQAPDYDSITSIVIHFRKFNTEAGADSVLIYGGSSAAAPLITALSGNTIPAEIIVNGNKAFVVFKTNAVTNDEGWLFDYSTNFPLYCSGLTTYTEYSGTLEDGSGDKNYLNNSICRWKIDPPGEMPVKLTFNNFSTYDSSDLVKVYDMQNQILLGEFSGNQLPPTLVSNSGKILIMFSTNGSHTSSGWSASWVTSGTASSLSIENEKTFVYPNPACDFIKINTQQFIADNCKVTICINDLMGEKLIEKTLEIGNVAPETTIDLGNLPASAYYLIIQSCNKTQAFRFIKINR